jgi:acetyl-CoA synthetase
MRITYRELLDAVQRFAHILQSFGVSKGDRIIIYMPMIPEAVYAMLACARIGAIHSVVFAGFSANSLAHRIDDCEPKLLITTSGAVRGGKPLYLKKCTDEALKLCQRKPKILVVDHNSCNESVVMEEGRDFWYHDCLQNVDDSYFSPVAMNAEDPLFILYTSGSTGKPKGIQHSTAGYLVYAATTFARVFDHKNDDIHWCTADIGWITGHSYVVYGPLANGATILLFEGSPFYPDHTRLWDICEKHHVTILYTAPTIIRALMQTGEDYTNRYDISSLRVIGSVGEPLNPEAARWYRDTFGHGTCPVIDTWWQTETGGIMIAPSTDPSIDFKPGSVMKPLPWVQLAILNEAGENITDKGEKGYLCIQGSWPGQLRTIYRDHNRFVQTYYGRFENMYLTGDSARMDADGDFWIAGRIDDVINVSGHRLGTAEIESVFVAHPKISEAGVVGIADTLKCQSIYVFAVLMADCLPELSNATFLKDLSDDLIDWVRAQISPIATPHTIQFCIALPKTRSGKIMRRLLRKIAEGNTDNLGDNSTLADPDVVDTLIEGKNTNAYTR